LLTRQEEKIPNPIQLPELYVESMPHILIFRHQLLCRGRLRYAGLPRLHFLIRHLYLNGKWLDVDVRPDAERHVFKEFELQAQNYLTILGLIVNIIGGTYMTIQ
jgi:hypothetical protein